ncbi:hypothetical protein RCL1_003320 [Eukaryota sp. TZLM3-RCL]
MPRHKDPIWTFVNVVDLKASGNSKVQCKSCNLSFIGGPERIKAHFGASNKESGNVAACTNVPESLSTLSTNTVQSATRTSSNSDQPLKRMRQPEIQEAFKNDLRNDADLALANWFYGQGISFNNADSVLFQNAIAAVIKAGPSYKPPSSYQLSTTLLDKAVDKIDSQLVPFKEELGLVPGTLVSDGWKNTNKVPLLNVLIATEHGSCFVDNVDTSGKSKTSDYVAEVIIDHINKVGEENVIQVITDNASECKAAGTIVEEVVPQVFWSPCTSHTVDLFLKDMPKHFPTFVSVFESVKAINQFMTARSSVHHIFRGHANLEIKTPGKTRFFSNFITLERTMKLRAAFERTLIDESFTEYVSLQERDYRVEASNLRTVVLSNEFWEHVEQLILLMKPAVDFINEVNGNSPSTGKSLEEMSNGT